MDTEKCIPANPDISGIGVRIAIYAQNLLCFVPVILYLSDGEISVDELAGIQDQSIGILVIAFAILITTVSLAAGRNTTVSNYHAAIILALSWMNNTSTWIWFILYVHERSKAAYKHVAATWPAWSGAESGIGRTSPGGKVGGRKQVLWSFAIKSVPPFARLILDAPVLIFGSIHLSMMATIGIWLWHDPSRFGRPIDRCAPMLTVFGASVPFNSIPLRIISLTMYALVLIPGLNLLLPFAFFLFLHISYNHVRKRIQDVVWPQMVRRSEADIPVHTAFLYVGLSCLVAINLLFIIDTELTLRRNLHNQSNEERDWGFGQILALLLLIVPLRDAWVALRTIQNNTQQRFEQAFRTVAQAETALKHIGALLAKGARPSQPISGRFGHCLQLAAHFGRLDLIELINPDQRMVNAVGGDYGTALQAAAARGHRAIVEYLLSCNADVNLYGGNYGTALCAACANGHVDVVNVLLGHNGIRKNKESEFGAPLHIAVLRENKSIVEALVKNKPTDVDCEWRKSGLNALDIATVMGTEEISRILRGMGLTAVRCGKL